MHQQEKRCKWLAAAGAMSVVGLGAAWPQPAWANGGGGGGAGGGGAGEHGTATHQHLDSRFAHNRYYYDRGFAVHTPARGGIANLIGRNGERYYFQGGNWYRWRGDWYRCWGGAWVVVDAPVGLFVPVLPPHHTTVWRNELRYEYANETYYVWDPGNDAYQVVAAP